MSRMNAAWSNEPPWAEAVPAIFKEPMTIAFGGAILAHAIFFLGLPVVAGSEKQPDVQPVATTVLTDQERAAVPADLAQSQFSPSAPMPGSNGLTMPPIPSIPSTPGGTVTTPGSGFGFGQLNEPTFSNGGYSTGSNSSDNSDFNTRLAEITRKQQEAQKAQQQVEEKKKKEEAIEAKINEENKNKPLANLPTVDTTKFPPSPSDGTQQTATNPATNPTTPQTIKPSPEASEEEKKKKYVALRTLNPNRTGPELDKSGTTARRTAFFTWMQSTDPKQGDSRQKKFIAKSGKMFKEWPEEFTLTLPKESDIPDYAQRFTEGYGEAVLGIAINESGNFEFDPEIVQSTGYPILDEYAIAYVRELMRNGKFGRTIQLYSMKIKMIPPETKPAA
jgi:hypothetical protein